MSAEKYIERYQQLIRVLRGLSRHERTKHFNMREWGVKTECGTTMCAAGFCGSDPWFRRRGFKFRLGVCDLQPDSGTLQFADKESWDAVALFFENERISFFQDVPRRIRSVFSAPRSVGEVIRAAQKRISELRKEKTKKKSA